MSWWDHVLEEAYSSHSSLKKQREIGKDQDPSIPFKGMPPMI
jgi:hypothetical protein